MAFDRRKAYLDPMLDDQSETIRFLADPARHGGQRPERVDTHISHLFIGPERVFKLKRAVRTNFLDFSTVARREAMCRRELEVNPAAGALYRGAHAVTREADGSLSLDGAGEAIDWVVEMVPFDRSTELDRLADDGALTRRHVELLADRVAWLHADAPRHPRRGEAEGAKARIEQIAGAIREADTASRLTDAVADWAAAAHRVASDQARLVEARGRHGFVRRGHGDLHLGNICLHDGQPTPFDAMEFNEEIATTDILYDAGFVVMDLLARGLREHAAVFTARYLSATRDYAGLALLPLFVSLRAAVRAIPTAADDPDTAGARLTQAVDALGRRPAARLVAVGGPSGSGKSTVARGLAAGMGDPFFAVVLRSDVARKRLMGVAPEEPLPEDAYERATGAEVYRRLRCDARRTLLAGFDAIVDASFLDTDEQGALRALAGRHGVTFTGLWLTAPADVMAQRISARRDDPSDATPAVLAKQIAEAPEAPGWLSIDASAEAEAVIRGALEAVQAG